MNYLYLPRIRVQTANAHATSWIINTAPLFAINMFGHNLGRNIGAMPIGVAVVHHDAQLLGEKEGKGFYGRLRPQQRRGASFIDGGDYSSKNKYALSLQPTASCHLTLSLVLAFDAPLDLDAVKEFMATARIAGGQVIASGAPEIVGDETALRARLRNGSWIIERADLMRGHADPLEAVIKTVGAKGGKSKEGMLPESWILPTVLGYAAITNFEQRGGVRGGYPHAYSEALVGLVQYVSLRDYGDRPLPLWRHTWLSEDVFVIQQKREVQS